MTDYIIELEDGRIVCFYEDDGKDRVILVTNKASFLKRDYRMPNTVKEVLAELEEMAKT